MEGAALAQSYVSPKIFHSKSMVADFIILFSNSHWYILTLSNKQGRCHRFIIFTTHSARAGYDTRSIFKQSLTGLNSEFSFSLTSSLTKAEEHSLSYYLPIAGGSLIVFIPFPRVLVLCEMQSVLSRIWTRVTVSISYDNNHYTMGIALLFNLLSCVHIFIEISNS